MKSSELKKFKVDYLGFQCRNENLNFRQLCFYFELNNISVCTEDYRNRNVRELVIDNRHNGEICAYLVMKEKGQIYQVDFRGRSARMMFEKLNPESFFNSSDFYLYRLDIAYDQTVTNKFSSKYFFNQCISYADKKKRVSNLISRPRVGKTLYLNNRRAQTFFRLYTKMENVLRTEMELKKTAILNQVFDINPESFKILLVNHFVRNLGLIVPLELPQFTWLALELRKLNSKPVIDQNINTLGFDYIKFNTLVENPFLFVNFAQLLTFTQKLGYSLETLGKINYRKFIFPVADFVRFKNPKVKRSSYQVQKLIDFFATLQENSLVQYFSEIEYRSLITIPQCNIQKVGKQWEVELYVAQDLYNHWLPYIVPDLFDCRLNKYEFDVRFKILQSYLTQSVRKEIDFKKFFNQYSKLSNLDRTRVKRSFLNGFIKFQQEGLILNDYKILHDGIVFQKSLCELKEADISDRIYFYEKIPMQY